MKPQGEKTMLAWHGEPGLKQAAMERLREHRRMDELIQGSYFPGNGKGCHLGCLTHSNRNAHELAARLFGIEERIGYWLEAVFEGLPTNECADWVLASTDSIPVGADMSICHHHFGAWLLGESGLLTITNMNRDAIGAVQQLHARAVAGEIVTPEQWSAAESAAWSARAAAWSAAWSAAESVESSAWSAAWSAKSAAYKKYAKQLLKLLKAAK